MRQDQLPCVYTLQPSASDVEANFLRPEYGESIGRERLPVWVFRLPI